MSSRASDLQVADVCFDSQLHDSIVSDPRLSSRQKAVVTQHLGNLDKCLTDGTDEQLQLLAFMGKILAINTS